jgi:hypothetical protein
MPMTDKYYITPLLPFVVCVYVYVCVCTFSKPAKNCVYQKVINVYKREIVIQVQQIAL